MDCLHNFVNGNFLINWFDRITARHITSVSQQQQKILHKKTILHKKKSLSINEFIDRLLVAFQTQPQIRKSSATINWHLQHCLTLIAITFTRASP